MARKRNTRRKTKRMKSCRRVSRRISRRVSRKRRRMRGGGDPLDPVGWASVGGVVKKGVTKSKGRNAAFKHSHEFQIGEVWKMNVEKVRGTAKVGFATEN